MPIDSYLILVSILQIEYKFYEQITLAFFSQTWETRYILLLWLSIICLVPFDMARFDGVGSSDKDSITAERQRPVVDRIIETAKVCQNKFTFIPCSENF